MIFTTSVPLTPPVTRKTGKRFVILIDTHIWLWWAFNPEKLSSRQLEVMDAQRDEGIGVCSICCWEVALLDKLGRINLGVPVGDWLADALNFPGVKWLPMTPEIAVAAVRLPEPIHRDPADRIIAATAMSYRSALLTADRQLLNYPHLETIN